MRSYLQLSKLVPRYVKEQRHIALLAPTSRSCGAPIVNELPITSTTVCSKRNPRHMSVNTRVSGRRPGLKSGETEEENHHGARADTERAPVGSSSSRKEIESSSNQSQREVYEEKNVDYHVDFTRVNEAPALTKEQWWYPDPFTGHYVPSSNYGQISSSIVLKEGTAIPDEKTGKKPAPKEPVKKLSGTPSKADKGGWWTSMEEMPDRWERC